MVAVVILLRVLAHDNDVVAGKSYQVKSFCDRERSELSPIKNNRAQFFQVKNSTMKLSGLNIFREYAKKL